MVLWTALITARRREADALLMAWQILVPCFCIFPGSFAQAILCGTMLEAEQRPDRGAHCAIHTAMGIVLTAIRELPSAYISGVQCFRLLFLARAVLLLAP